MGWQLVPAIFRSEAGADVSPLSLSPHYFVGDGDEAGLVAYVRAGTVQDDWVVAPATGDWSLTRSDGTVFSRRPCLYNGRPYFGGGGGLVFYSVREAAWVYMPGAGDEFPLEPHYAWDEWAAEVIGAGFYRGQLPTADGDGATFAPAGSFANAAGPDAGEGYASVEFTVSRPVWQWAGNGPVSRTQSAGLGLYRRDGHPPLLVGDLSFEVPDGSLLLPAGTVFLHESGSGAAPAGYVSQDGKLRIRYNGTAGAWVLGTYGSQSAGWAQCSDPPQFGKRVSFTGYRNEPEDGKPNYVEYPRNSFTLVFDGCRFGAEHRRILLAEISKWH
ncbi:MAG: hypothetical protein IJ783_02595 [Kiritimatiellae bacterium]|nr:hypothetical protein [Kiritimatiellia bacterium]